jgi:hypothetical protein
MSVHIVRYELQPSETRRIILDNRDLNKNRMLASLLMFPRAATDPPTAGVVAHLQPTTNHWFAVEDNQQIAWCGQWGVDAITDPMNILVEDIFLTNTDAINNVNVIATFVDVKSTNAEAILAMIRQRSQA